MIDTQAVKDVINQLDPEAALQSQADPYSDVAEDFADLLSRGQTMTTSSVTEVWTSWFDRSTSALAAQRELATQLAERLNTIR